jgi:hypothetical protein
MAGSNGEISGRRREKEAILLRQEVRRDLMQHPSTDNLHARLLDFRGFDSDVVSISRGGNKISMRSFPESLRWSS